MVSPLPSPPTNAVPSLLNSDSKKKNTQPHFHKPANILIQHGKSHRPQYCEIIVRTRQVRRRTLGSPLPATSLSSDLGKPQPGKECVIVEEKGEGASFAVVEAGGAGVESGAVIVGCRCRRTWPCRCLWRGVLVEILRSERGCLDRWVLGRE